MLFIGEKVGPRGRQSGAGGGAAGRWTSPSIRSRARTCARPVRPTRWRCWRPRTAADCCMRPISTCRSSSSVRAAKHAVSLDASVSDNLRRDCAIARARHRGSRGHRPRSPAPRAVDRGDPRDRRADPPDQRRRPVGGHCRGRGRQRRARGDGHRRRPGRRHHRSGHALPERRNLRAPDGDDAGARSALPRHGHHGLPQGSTRRRISRPATASSLPRPASPTAR